MMNLDLSIRLKMIRVSPQLGRYTIVSFWVIRHMEGESAILVSEYAARGCRTNTQGIPDQLPFQWYAEPSECLALLSPSQPAPLSAALVNPFMPTYPNNTLFHPWDLRPAL